jgi:hypothetical protein
MSMYLRTCRGPGSGCLGLTGLSGPGTVQVFAAMTGETSTGRDGAIYADDKTFTSSLPDGCIS